MRLALKLFLCMVAAQAASAQDVRIGVLGLFRPHQLALKASPTQALIIEAQIVEAQLIEAQLVQASPAWISTVDARKRKFVLERSSGLDAVQLTVCGNQLQLQIGNQLIQASAIHVASRSGDAADFVLAIPGKITRKYHGALDVGAHDGVLVPVVRMDLETAVASAVQAESDPDTPMEALKAQAVATRSYFVAGRGRHHEFDFCDTTHCQFLREPPPPNSSVSRAASATRGLVLAYQDQAVPAMFTRSCGGRTRTPQELGMSGQGYPYFPVVCEYCLGHPATWTRQVSHSEVADLNRRGEASRLDIDRRLGWDAVPSNNFTAHADVKGAVLQGVGQGHGIGLCQRGGRAMAEAGATFYQILDHYYPNTTLIEFHQPPGWSASSM